MAKDFDFKSRAYLRRLAEKRTVRKGEGQSQLHESGTPNQTEVEEQADRIPQLVIPLGFGLDEQKKEKKEKETLYDSPDILHCNKSHIPSASINKLNAFYSAPS